MYVRLDILLTHVLWNSYECIVKNLQELLWMCYVLTYQVTCYPFLKWCSTYTLVTQRHNAQLLNHSVLQLFFAESPFCLSFLAVLVLCRLAFDQILYEKKKPKCSEMSIIQWFLGCHSYQYGRLSSVWIIFFSHQSVRSPLFTALESVSWRYPSGKHSGKKKYNTSSKACVDDCGFWGGSGIGKVTSGCHTAGVSNYE